MAIDDLHWGLVWPMAFHDLRSGMLGTGPLVSVVPGDLHWGLVVPMALQFPWCSSGSGPFVSVAPGDVHWGLVVPMTQYCAVVGPYNGVVDMEVVMSYDLSVLSGGLVAPVGIKHGNLHWGLVVPTASRHGLWAVDCYKSGIGPPVSSAPDALVVPMAIQRSCGGDLGSGPLVSAAPGDLHWGLVVPMHGDLHWGLVVAMASTLVSGDICSVSSAPGALHWGLVVPMVIQRSCGGNLGSGPRVSAALGDLHWGLVVPMPGVLHWGLVVPMASILVSGDICSVPNAPGALHWGLVVPMVIQRSCGGNLGSGPLVSAAPGALHWGLVVPMAIQRSCGGNLGSGPLVSAAPGDLHWGLVVPMPGDLHWGLVVPMASTLISGDICSVSNAPGALHWGLVVPMVIQRSCGGNLGSGPRVSVALGDLHWGLVVPMSGALHWGLVVPKASVLVSGDICSVELGVVTPEFTALGDLHWGLVLPVVILFGNLHCEHSGLGVVYLLHWGPTMCIDIHYVSGTAFTLTLGDAALESIAPVGRTLATCILLSYSSIFAFLQGGILRDDGSWRLTGDCFLLQRQIVLSAVPVLPQPTSLLLAEYDLMVLLVCELLGKLLLRGFLHVGDLTMQFFCTLAVVSGLYLFGLLCHATGLRGGRYNADNLVRAARVTASWIPLQFGQPVQDMTGRAGRFANSPGCSTRRCAYSRDFWLLLIMLSSLLDCAAAAGGPVASDLHPSFRVVFGRSTILDIDNTPLTDLPQAVRQDDSDSESDGGDSSVSSSVSVEYHNVLFRAFGFGFVPEYYSVRLRCGTALYRALELIEVDIEVATRSSRGHFIPLMGAPIDEAYPVLWVPHWIQPTGKRLAVMDATHVAWESSVLLFEDSVVTIRVVAEMLHHIWQPHWQIFIPARWRGPLTPGIGVSINNGDVIFITPDAFCPPFHDNSVAAYTDYDHWGDDPGAEGVPMDLPHGPRFVQVVHDEQTCLVEVDTPSDDLHILGLTAALIQPRMPNPRLLRPTEYFHPSTCRGTAVEGPVYLDPGDVADESFAVFMDLRGIGRENSVAILRDRIVATEDLAQVLGLFVEAVDGYFLAVKGGHRSGGFVELWPGCVLRACIISVAEAFSDASSDENDNQDGRDDNVNGREHDSMSAGDARDPGSGDRARSRSRSPRQAVTGLEQPGADDGVDEAARCSVARRTSPQGTLFGVMWGRYMAAAVFFNAWIRGGSVILPCHEDFPGGADASAHHFTSVELPVAVSGTDWSMWMPTTFDDDGERPGADTPRVLFVPTCTVLHGCPDQDRDEFSFLALSELRTVLDDAKSNDLWALCDNLAWFLQTLEGHNTSADAAACSGEAVGCPFSYSDGSLKFGSSLGSLPTQDVPPKVPILIAAALDLPFRGHVCLPAPDGLFPHSHEPDRSRTINHSTRLLRIPETWVLPQTLLQHWDSFGLVRDVTDWDLHPHTVIALELAAASVVWRGDLHCGDSAGWSVVIVSNDPLSGSCSFIGCFGGKIGGDCDLGSSKADALQAEQSALCWACLWVLPQLADLLVSFRNIFFCWDCTSAGLGASGDCCLADSPLSGPLRGLLHCFRTLVGKRYKADMSRRMRVTRGMNLLTRLQIVIAGAIIFRLDLQPSQAPSVRLTGTGPRSLEVLTCLLCRRNREEAVGVFSLLLAMALFPQMLFRYKGALSCQMMNLVIPVGTAFISRLLRQTYKA